MTELSLVPINHFICLVGNSNHTWLFLKKPQRFLFLLAACFRFKGMSLSGAITICMVNLLIPPQYGGIGLWLINILTKACKVCSCVVSALVAVCAQAAAIRVHLRRDAHGHWRRRGGARGRSRARAAAQPARARDRLGPRRLRVPHRAGTSIPLPRTPAPLRSIVLLSLTHAVSLGPSRPVSPCVDARLQNFRGRKRILKADSYFARSPAWAPAKYCIFSVFVFQRYPTRAH